MGVQVKLWNPLTTRAIHQRFSGEVLTERRYIKCQHHTPLPLALVVPLEYKVKVKFKSHAHDIAPLSEETSLRKRWGMARIVEEFHS